MTASIVLVVRWTQDTVHREQAYGPWTPREDGAHHGEMAQFMRNWNADHPSAEFVSASMYLVVSPDRDDVGQAAG
jgi:hypothetical protein